MGYDLADLRAARDALAERVQAVEAELECAKEALVYIWEKEDRLRAERDALAERVERLREARRVPGLPLTHTED